MQAEHPVRYLVSVMRNNHIRHQQLAETLTEAEELAERMGAAAGTEVEISEVHERAETDLTTHTRELVEELQEASD